MNRHIIFTCIAYSIIIIPLAVAMETEINRQRTTKENLYQLLCATYYLNKDKVKNLITKDSTLIVKRFCFFQISPLQLTSIPRNNDKDEIKNNEIKILFYETLFTSNIDTQRAALFDTIKFPPLCAIATFCGDEATLQTELKKNFPVRFAQEYHLNPLFHIAIANNDVNIIKCLLQEPRLTPFIQQKLYPKEHNNYKQGYNIPPLDYARKLANRETIITLLEQHPRIQKQLQRLEKIKNIPATTTIIPATSNKNLIYAGLEQAAMAAMITFSSQTYGQSDCFYPLQHI